MPAIKRRVAHYIWPESETRLCPSETRRSLVAFSPPSPPGPISYGPPFSSSSAQSLSEFSYFWPLGMVAPVRKAILVSPW
jgi:hypothetical protein